MAEDQGSDKKAASEKKPELKIYDSAMCCSTGVRGKRPGQGVPGARGSLKDPPSVTFKAQGKLITVNGRN